MTSQRDALIRLLTDEDPDTLAIIKGQLVGRGREALSELRKWMAAAPPAAARHLQDVVAQIEGADADAVFSRLCANFGPNSDLEEAVWWLAATFLPGENFSQQRSKLDAWGAEVARRLTKAATPLDQIETLVEYLSSEAGLRGNEDDYYNINNSLLPEVIDTGLGIPISLSLVYILVGKRAGITISGVGLPGHFLIRHENDFFDPFNDGRRVGLVECRERLASLNLTLNPSHLEPMSPPQFLIRMLANIHAIAADREPDLAARIQAWLELLNHAASN